VEGSPADRPWRGERGAPIPRIAQVAFVAGTTAGGTGAHVRMLAAGFAGRGIGVSVLGPASAEAAFGFGALAGVTFSPVEFGDRPRVGDLIAVLRLRRLLSSSAGLTVRPDTVPPDTVRPDVMHAHGLRAGALTAIAIAGLRRRAGGRRRPALVVTVHNAPPVGGGARLLVYRLLERVVARGADLVLCVSPDLEARMRGAGARQVGRAVVSARETATTTKNSTSPATTSTTETTPVSAPRDNPDAVTVLDPGDTSAGERPVVLAVGRLAAQKDFGTLLEAAASWRDLDPVPLLAIAGDGPLAGELRAQAASLGVDAAFLGHRDDVADLLAGAALFVLPSRWEGQPLILQEALRAGAAIVATRVGGVPDLVGDDAAVLVRPGDAQAVAAAVRAVLADASLAGRLRAAAAERGAALPTAADAVAAALVAYAQALAPT
jgi:glycosyltransferase involved in cell wall biosynthesis